MPKVTVTYNLPDEEVEYRVSLAAMRMLSTLEECDRILRGYVKYGEYPEEEKARYAEVRRIINEGLAAVDP